VLDKVRKEYNELMEKHLKTPKKVTTVTTTVDHGPKRMDTPQIEDEDRPKQIEAKERPEMSEKEV